LKEENLVFGNAGQLLSEYLGNSNFSGLYVLTDSNTTRYCLPQIVEALPLETQFIEIPAGENNKSLDNCCSIWNALQSTADRNSLLVSLGGGVVSDIGGFCASVFKRGMNSCFLPTTLLGMADAAIGGKNGIDYGGEKNLIGTFYDPRRIIIDTSFLDTLPERQIMAGFAEVLKYGLIFDRQLWEETIAPDQNLITIWIKKCIEIKISIISNDPFDHAFRKILNFGHTIGHAIESYSLAHDKCPLLHGEAIATGMILETLLSADKGLIKSTEAEMVIHRIENLYKPYALKQEAISEILTLIHHDKKNSGGFIRFSLISGIGRCSYDVVCSEEEILTVLNSYFHL
jgi:3-dehydroquinate synthase